MQRRKFLGLSSLAATASLFPHLLSEASEQVTQGASAHAAQASEPGIPRWQPHDFSFPSRRVPQNPFTAAFEAMVTGPSGERLTVPGFYDGPGKWKVRVAPNAVGRWSLVTQSTDPDLNQHRVSFLCVPNDREMVHGGLRIDTEHPSQFIFEDGAHFFPMGYECDWLWALDSANPGLTTLNPFLEKISAHGFNMIILNAFAYDTSWRKGRTGDDDYGPPPLYAWEGSNEHPDHSRFHLAYWQHYDRVIEALYRRGIVAHILLRVYNKQVNWPANGSPEDDLYYRWLIARYAAYPNVTWDYAKEAHYEKDLDYKKGRLRYLRANDPYRRLLTVHDDRANYDRGIYNDLVDYRSDQQHTDWRKTMLGHLQQHSWPVINTEFGYECGPNGPEDKTYNVAQLPEEVCRRAWEVYMAGGSGVYYYTYSAWDVIRPKDTPPGYGYFKNLRDFFQATSYWKMKPADGVTDAGYCLADAGREYVVFLNAATPFTLTLEGLAVPLVAEWYQPFSGARKRAVNVSNGRSAMVPPQEWGGGPVALHLVSAKA